MMACQDERRRELQIWHKMSSALMCIEIHQGEQRTSTCMQETERHLDCLHARYTSACMATSIVPYMSPLGVKSNSMALEPSELSSGHELCC